MTFARLQLLAAVAFASLALTYSCAKKSSRGKSTSPIQPVEESQPTASTSGEGTGGTTLSITATTNVITSILSGLLPGSLALNNSSHLRLLADTCDGSNGYFDCQPKRLKVHLASLKQMTSLLATTLTSVSSSLNEITIGTLGTLELSSGNGPSSIEYNVESATKFQLIFFMSGAPSLYVEADGNISMMRIDTSAFIDDEESGGGGMIEALITHTSNDFFDATITLAEIPCDPDDIRAPSKIILDLNRSDALWTGKAMFFHPRWNYAGQAMTCQSTATSDSPVAIYFDFVGNSENTTASTYIVPSTITAKDFSNYAMSQLCTNFATMCSGGYALDDSELVTSYANYLCIPATGNAVWGTACTSSVAAITSATFLAADLWVAPADLKSQTVEIPTSLQ